MEEHKMKLSDFLISSVNLARSLFGGENKRGAALMPSPCNPLAIDPNAIKHLTNTVATNNPACNPAWGSKYTYQVHQESIERVLSGSLSKTDATTLKNAIQEADKAEWQTVEFSYRHAMTPSGMSKTEARRLANEFVRDNLNTARRLEAGGDRRGAMYHLGLAMHCLQDSTSLAHSDDVCSAA
jgi:hypothetical protein